MGMIKISVKNCRSAQGGIDYNKFNEMKDWCRETFGKNKITESYTWFTRKEFLVIETDTYTGPRLFPAFYFAKQEHANWFILKWT